METGRLRTSFGTKSDAQLTLRIKLIAAMLLAALVLSLSLSVLGSSEAYAATDSVITAKLEQVKKKTGYIPGKCNWKKWTDPDATSWDDCSSGCWHFMGNVERMVFGRYPNNPSGHKMLSPNGYTLVGQHSGTAADEPSLTQVKTLLKKAYPGDVIQFRSGPNGYAGGKYGQHSAIVYAVTDTSITIYEHLDSSHVTLKTWAFTSLYSNYLNFNAKTSYTKGVSLYHASNYGKHTFYFVDKDGTTLCDSATAKDDKAISLPTPTKSGYVFKGWKVKRLADSTWYTSDGWSASGTAKIFKGGSAPVFDAGWIAAPSGKTDMPSHSNYRLYATWAKKITSSSVTLSKSSATYDGACHIPTVSVVLNGTKLTADKDYTVAWSGACITAKSYTVTITGKGSYGGTVKKTFTINPQALTSSNITLSAVSFVYSGSVKKPAVTVKNAAGTVIGDALTASNGNVKVTYSTGCKAIGTYKVTVAGTGNYQGSFSKSFKIKPSRPAVKSLTPGAKSFTLKWTAKASSAAATGYQIRYSTNPDFPSASTKTITLTSYKTASKTVSNLKAKREYCVQIRTYKTVNDTKYYSTWSAKKYVTAK